MKDRAIEIVEFISRAGWEGAAQIPLRADFSSRRFARLEREGSTTPHAVLMDADPDQKTEAFTAIAGILCNCEISAPQIYAAKPDAGLVLMEDFGDCNLGRLLDEGAEAALFCRRAADVLVHLHQRFDKSMIANIDLPHFDSALFVRQVELFLDAWFVLAKERAATVGEKDSFRAAWIAALSPIDQLPQTLMLRDFMMDNMMDLTGRAEWRSVGVLDFQDGGIGPIAYDLASLCEVVRRDGNEKMLDDMIDYYHQKAMPSLAKNELRRTCRILAAQRHMRILGIIANRALKTGQRDKLEYAPRIWDYLGDLLQDETLKPVREWIVGIFQQGIAA